MLERIKQFILSNHLPGGEYNTILAAVSGGVDSCVLLDILHRLSSELKFGLVVIHFNHRVRGKASQADERFVKKLAAAYGVKIITAAAERIPLKKNETALRELRYNFYQEQLKKNAHALLATGHSSSDQVETFIMRLAKGSHLQGLLGIKPRSGRLIHPLLGESRRDIIRYAARRGLKFREDRTNRDVKILRNRIRHKVIPCLKKNLGDAIEHSFGRTISDLAGYYRIYQQVLNEKIRRNTRQVKGTLYLQRAGYARCDTVLRRGLLEYCISKVYPINYHISDRAFAQWDQFILKVQSGRKKAFQQHEIALAGREYIHFGKGKSRAGGRFRLPLGGKVAIKDSGTISFERISAGKIKFSPDRNIEIIDGDCSGTDLQIRFWKRGDYFRPLGLAGDKKLSDFFIDQKLDREVKRKVPLVCRGNNIVWIAGYRLDDRFKITGKTKKYFRLELKLK